jgi:hypothetical protein
LLPSVHSPLRHAVFTLIPLLPIPAAYAGGDNQSRQVYVSDPRVKNPIFIFFVVFSSFRFPHTHLFPPLLPQPVSVADVTVAVASAIAERPEDAPAAMASLRALGEATHAVVAPAARTVMGDAQGVGTLRMQGNVNDHAYTARLCVCTAAIARAGPVGAFISSSFFFFFFFFENFPLDCPKFFLD